MRNARRRDRCASRIITSVLTIILVACPSLLVAGGDSINARDAKRLRDAMQPSKAPSADASSRSIESAGTVSAGVLGACCTNDVPSCSADLDEMACSLLFGVWNPGASCSGASGLPTPICNQIGCGYDNGPILDRNGAVLSTYAPDTGGASAAVDDFVVRPGDGAPCRITGIRSWVTHNDPDVFPTSDYQGVNVTIYTDVGQGLATTGPAGVPESDGSHTGDFLGGIVYSQRHPMSTLSATQQLGVNCLGFDLWKLDIPVDIVLVSGTRYWLEVQPIMNASIGQAFRVLSDNSNGPKALRIAAAKGVVDWTTVTGNTATCLATPPAGTRTDLAFMLFGETRGLPPNDDCASKTIVSDGVVAFETTGALTDGPEVPASCDLGVSTQVRQDVWFEYTASCSGNLTMSLCGSDFDSEVVVYRGCGTCPPSVDPVACSEDAGVCGNDAQVTFPTTPGVCYTMRVGGFFGDEGPGLLTIDCETPGIPTGACCSGSICIGTLTDVACQGKGGTWFVGQECPAFGCPVTNDDCIDCIPIFTNDVVIGSTVGASGATISSCSMGDVKDVWHCWTADCDGAAVIGLCDSNFDTTLAVYDACGGNELICNDNHCTANFASSELDPFTPVEELVLPVTSGQTYYIRVSGFSGDSGDYALSVDSCVNGCCLPDGQCFNVDETTCLTAGTPLPAGTLCQGDSDGNRTDDACESCPTATINLGLALPANGTVDSRQPYAPGGLLPRQGIGSPGGFGSIRETIFLTLNPPVTGASACFALCETAADSLLGANGIAQTIDRGDGSYEIVLTRPITAGAVTTIEYIVDGSAVSYTSHPANVDGDAMASTADVAAHISCCVLGACVPAWGIYSCDIDHSGSVGPADMLRVIDLLNGADLFDPWGSTSLPQNTICP